MIIKFNLCLSNNMQCSIKELLEINDIALFKQSA